MVYLEVKVIIEWGIPLGFVFIDYFGPKNGLLDPGSRVSLTTFRPPVHFPIFPEEGVRVARFRPEGGG